MPEYNDENTFPMIDGSVRVPDTAVDLYIRKVEPYTKEDKISWKLTLEVLAPENISIGGKMFSISGKEITTYVGISKMNLHTKFGLLAFYSACGYKRTLNTDEPWQVKDQSGEPVNVPFTGKVVRAIVNTRAKPKKAYAELTPAQKAAGEKADLVAVFDDNNQPVIVHELQLAQWIGPSNVTAPGQNF